MLLHRGALTGLVTRFLRSVSPREYCTAASGGRPFRRYPYGVCDDRCKRAEL